MQEPSDGLELGIEANLLWDSAAAMPVPGVESEMRWLIDPGDYGGVYGSVSGAQRTANKTLLDDIRDAIVAASPIYGGGIILTGPQIGSGDYTDEHTGALFQIDTSAEAFLFPTGTPFELRGVGGSQLQCVGSATNADQAGVKVERVSEPQGSWGSVKLSQRITDLKIRSFSRAVYLKSTGRGLRIAGCQFFNSDTSPNPTKAALYDLDEPFTSDPADLDNPCALLIENADNGYIDVELSGSGYHGMIVKRWHAGSGSIRVSGARGAGMKGREFNGFNGDITAESCGQYGLYLVRSELSTLGQLWCENNLQYHYTTNTNLGRTVSVGSRYRQIKLRRSFFNRILGHSGWSDNQFDVDWGSRNANRFSQHETPRTASDAVITTDFAWNTDSLVQADLDDNNNHATVWTNAAFRPALTLVSGSPNSITIEIPASCYNNASAQSSLTPFGSFSQPSGAGTTPDFEAGDVIHWEAEVSVDQAGVDHATRNDAPHADSQNAGGTIDGRPRQLIIKFAAAGAEDTGKGQSTVNLWDTERRKFSSEYTIESGDTSFPSPVLIIYAVGQEVMATNPQADFILTVHSYEIRLRRKQTTVPHT